MSFTSAAPIPDMVMVTCSRMSWNVELQIVLVGDWEGPTLGLLLGTKLGFWDGIVDGF